MLKVTTAVFSERSNSSGLLPKRRRGSSSLVLGIKYYLRKEVRKDVAFFLIWEIR
jgi:hypothetical protein